ncbi:HET-domain-containing protein, partial [Cadophora sp. DSE1049]
MDYERLRRLIDTCRDSHNRCDFDFNRGMGKLSPDTLFIDVKKLCLVQLPTPTAVFVALSYVWGDAVTFKTEQANRALLMEEGVFERLKDQIPKTIHDAMTLVRRLGFDFLWVDAFCIVQDDEEHKKKQIDNMSVIYSESILTIIALTASDAARGLAGVDNNSRPLKVVSVTENSSLSAHTQNLRVLRDSSVYKTRAWTFQEEVMSRRRLYITDWQYYLAC